MCREHMERTGNAKKKSPGPVYLFNSHPCFNGKLTQERDDAGRDLRVEHEMGNPFTFTDRKPKIPSHKFRPPNSTISPEESKLLALTLSLFSLALRLGQHFGYLFAMNVLSRLLEMRQNKCDHGWSYRPKESGPLTRCMRARE